MSVQVLILAAGLGKRMGGEVPKALAELKGKPLISYLLETIDESGVCDNPAIVIGPHGTEMPKLFGNKYIYILQSEQLGTGHAVMTAKQHLPPSSDVLILLSDQPAISAETIKKVAKKQNSEKNILTLATTTVTDFDEWRHVFQSFGKILRDGDGKISGIKEVKDCSDDEKKINELNPSIYCFDSEWLWDNIEKIENKNAQSEYLLTDLIAMVCQNKLPISSVSVDPREAFGIDTPKDLQEAQQLLQEKK